MQASSLGSIRGLCFTPLRSTLVTQGGQLSVSARHGHPLSSKTHKADLSGTAFRVLGSSHPPQPFEISHWNSLDGEQCISSGNPAVYSSPLRPIPPCSYGLPLTSGPHKVYRKHVPLAPKNTNPQRVFVFLSCQSRQRLLRPGMGETDINPLCPPKLNQSQSKLSKSLPVLGGGAPDWEGY